MVSSSVVDIVVAGLLYDSGDVVVVVIENGTLSCLTNGHEQGAMLAFVNTPGASKQGKQAVEEIEKQEKK